MESNIAKTLHPISVAQFRSGVLKYFVAQMFLIVLFLLFLNSDYKNHPFSFQIILGLSALAVGVTAFGFRPGDYQSRFKDIYPNYELKKYMLILMILIPLLYLAFTIFLCFKEKASSEKPFGIFIHNYSYGAFALVLFASQFASNKWAFLSASPSTYYIFSIASNAKDVMKLRQMGGTESIFDKYSKNKTTKYSTTELTLLAAAITSQIIDKKERSIASEKMNKLDSNFIYGIMLLEEMNKIIKVSDNLEIDFFDFGPAQWVVPSGAIEIFLLSAIEHQIRNKLNETLVVKLTEIQVTMDKKLALQTASVQALYKHDLMKVKKDLNSSKIYRSMASEK